MKKNKTVLAFILLVTGFIVAFSYQYVQNANDKKAKITSKQWEREHDLRTQLINEQETNRGLQHKIDKDRVKIQGIEQKLADQKTASTQLVADLAKYRMINGLTKVKGTGIEVKLSDADYVPENKDPNNYIVHQQDIQEVIYELYAIGAEAIAINDQRISSHSYIECVGPVVKVDGQKHTAPFIISAIGPPDMLMDALNMNGGTVDLLVARGIDVTVEKKSSIVLNPLM